jgi:hypothetical protein
MKSNGQKLETIRFLDTWLTDNVDELFPKLKHYFFNSIEPQQKLMLESHKKFGKKNYDNVLK